MKSLNNFDISEYAPNIIGSMTDSLIVISPVATILAVNASTEKLLGYKESEVKGKTIGVIIVDENFTFFKLIRDMISKGNIYNYEIDLLAKDGEKIPVEFCGSVMKNEDGEIIGVVTVARDMRKIKNLILELTMAKSSLETKVKEKTEKIVMAYNKLKSTQSQLIHQEKMSSIGLLAAGVAHEINNPIGFIHSNLGTLKGYTEDLKMLLAKHENITSLVKLQNIDSLKPKLFELEQFEKEIDKGFIIEDLTKVIEESRDGSLRVKDIVSGLRDFCHLDDSTCKIADINSGIESTLKIIWNEIKYKATVTKDYGNIPEIKCYPMELNQVFMNLLINAAHSIGKSGEISIKTYREGDFINILISDTGSGIKKENIPHIFDPFFTTKPVGKGTGLGLSISYKIIKKHNGSINVESEDGVGTKFHIKLPIL